MLKYFKIPFWAGDYITRDLRGCYSQQLQSSQKENEDCNLISTPKCTLFISVKENSYLCVPVPVLPSTNLNKTRIYNEILSILLPRKDCPNVFKYRQGSCFTGHVYIVYDHCYHMSDPCYMVQCHLMLLHKSSPETPDTSKDGRGLHLQGGKEKDEKEQITWKQTLNVLHYFFTMKRIGGKEKQQHQNKTLQNSKGQILVLAFFFFHLLKQYEYQVKQSMKLLNKPMAKASPSAAKHEGKIN